MIQFKIIIFLFLCCFLLIEVSCKGYSYTDEEKLRSLLFTSYNAKTRPGKRIEVNVSLSLFSLRSLDIETETMDLAGYLYFIWEDARLDWSNNANFSGTLGLFFATDNDIWVPRIIIENSISDIGVINDGVTPIKILKEGFAYWAPARLFRTHCDIDVTYFPFDTQICQITLTPWGYDSAVIPLVFEYPAVITQYYKVHGEWDYLGYEATSEPSKRNGDDVSLTSFNLKFRRKPLFQFLNTIVPSFLLALLNGVVFKLPADCGEKNGYVLTVLLAYAVYMSIVSSSIPTTSKHICVLTIFLLTILIMSVISVVVTAISLNYYFRDEQRHTMPKCTRKSLMTIARIIGWERSMDRCCCTSSVSVSKVDIIRVISTDRGILDTETSNLGNENDIGTRNNINDNDIQFTWKNASEVIDALSFIIYYCLLCVVSVVIGAILLNGYYTQRNSAYA